MVGEDEPNCFTAAGVQLPGWTSWALELLIPQPPVDAWSILVVDELSLSSCLAWELCLACSCRSALLYAAVQFQVILSIKVPQQDTGFLVGRL